jgi:hypothetical protein
MRANTAQGRRLRTELIDIVTMWMNGEPVARRVCAGNDEPVAA